MPERPQSLNPNQNPHQPGNQSPREVARAALNRIKAASGRRPTTDAEARRRAARAAAEADTSRGGGLRPFGGILKRVMDERGWSQSVAVGSVTARWPEVAGAQVAEHVTPEGFEDGVLTLRADSSTWATQIGLLSPTILRRMDEEVGEGVVTKIKVLGPTGRSFKRGPLSVPGRGPRDTWG